MDPEIPIDLGIQKVLQDLDIHFYMLMKLKNWEMMLYTTNKTGEKTDWCCRVVLFSIQKMIRVLWLQNLVGEKILLVKSLVQSTPLT